MLGIEHAELPGNPRFARSDSQWGHEGTLVDLLRFRAIHQAGKRAFTFLKDRGAESEAWTYADLDRRARAIATQVQQMAGAGDPVLLLYPPGLEFIAAFFGCLYAGVIAIPVYPPRRPEQAGRVEALRLEAGARLALTAGQFTDGWFSASLRCFSTHSMIDDAGQWREPAITSDTVALLQFTSGSTAAPRGVILSHKSILFNQSIIQEAFEHCESTVVVGWLPLYHDMGLIGNVIQPLFVGGSCVLMSPTAFLLKPVRWLQAITRYRGNTSGAPNFAYELCVRKVNDEQRATLELSSWDLAYNGSEPVRDVTINRFSSAFAACGFRREAFYPCYGLAESTLFVAGGEKQKPLVVDEREHVPFASRATVSCGWARCGHVLKIVDPDTYVKCEPGAEGEVWISGPCVAQGYWSRPEQTKETFGAFLSTGEGPFLRTGDLGYVSKGDLFVVGRSKDVIIVRGRNHSPEDIERTIEQVHSALRPSRGAAFSVEVEDEERLVIAYELDRHFGDISLDQLMDDIRQAVSKEHGLQARTVLLLKSGTVPRTSSGKIQRSRCREAYLSGVWTSARFCESKVRESVAEALV
jgi:acyl-CoA synthetase (AMP-forming)/AMP-acid ligase II